MFKNPILPDPLTIIFHKRLQQILLKAGRFSNNNCNVPSCNCNNSISVLNNNTFPTRTSIFTDYNNYQQSTSCSTSNNTDIISPGHNYYEQQISCDVSTITLVIIISKLRLISFPYHIFTRNTTSKF